MTLEGAEPISIQVPWPVKMDGIKVSIVERNNERAVHLIMKKSLNDPFPSEFGRSLPLVVDDLKPWKDLDTNGDLQVILNFVVLSKIEIGHRF